MTEPLEKRLRPALSPDRVERVWRRIAEQRDRKRAPFGRAFAGPSAWAFAAAVVVAVCGSTWIALHSGVGTETVASGSVAERGSARGAAGPAIARVDGSAIGEIATAESDAIVSLNDGSELRVSPQTRLLPLELSERAVVLHLLRGRTRFSVKPGGPRRWVIEAGGASVEVVGTKFTVEREQGVVSVQVEEGKVLVRSAAIEDGVARLTAGESLVVPPPSDAKVAPAPTAAPAPADRALLDRAPLDRAGGASDATTQVASTQAPSTKIDRVQVSKEQRPARSKETATSPSQAQEGFALGALDANALLEMADQARMKRDYRAALGALDRVVQEHGTDPRAKLAAFTIGRIRDEELLDPERAALAYEQALSLGLAGPLAEDCRIRLLRVLEAQVKRGSVSGDRVVQAAEDYLRRYPRGRYATEARAKLE